MIRTSLHRTPILVALLLAGCGKGEGEVSIPAGEERGPCRADGSCDDGLTCLSNLCVVYGSSSDVGVSPEDMGISQPDDAGANNNGFPDLAGLDLGMSETTPTAPSELQAMVAGNAIALFWTDNSDDEGGFVVERKDDVLDAEFVDLDFLPANTATYTDDAVYKGVAYTYRVRAVNNAGSSSYTNEAPVSTPPPTLQADVVPVFERSCGANTGACHARNQYAATADRDCRGWLALENAAIGAFVYDMNGNNMQSTGCEDRDLHYRLTQIRAWQCGGDFVRGDADYVVPGDLANSYLWQKMEGTRLCEVGGQPSERMPQTGQLSTADRMIIRQWIVTGAAP